MEISLRGFVVVYIGENIGMGRLTARGGVEFADLCSYYMDIGGIVRNTRYQRGGFAEYITPLLEYEMGNVGRKAESNAPTASGVVRTPRLYGQCLVHSTLNAVRKGGIGFSL